MGKPGGYLEHKRVAHKLRPVAERVQDYNDLYIELDELERKLQASRCMMCGVAFCQTGFAFGKARSSGCPLHNLIPEWNDLLWRGQMQDAVERLALTSPLPEFTSRVCPAPCEASCNLAQKDEAETIHDNERAISDWEWAHGGPKRFAKAAPDAKRVAVVGSGPAGLTCAWELARLGAKVVVYERDDRAGGLLMYGIPNMKLEKDVVTRRTDLMSELGIEFKLGRDAADPAVVEELKSFDAVVVAVGARSARGLSATGFAEGLEQGGVRFAVDYLSESTKALLEERETTITAAGKHVVVIGGGDTGNDCVGTAVRQGAASVTQFEFLPCPPDKRADGDVWPQYPNFKKTDYGQLEAIDAAGSEIREWAVDTLDVLFDAEGKVCALNVVDVDWSKGKPERKMDSLREVKADLVLIACGFTGPEAEIYKALDCELTEPPRVLPKAADTAHAVATSFGVPVFAAGDGRSGSSLVVNAMADALACVSEVAHALEL